MLLKSTRTRPDPRQLPQRDRTGGGRLRQGCRRSGGGGLGASGGQFLQQSRKYKISMNIIEYIYIYFILYILYIYILYIYYMRVCIFLHRYNGMYIMLLYYIIVFYVILIIILFYFLFYAILYVYIYIYPTQGINRINSRYMQSGSAGSQTNSDGVNDRDIKWTMFDTNIYHNYIIYIYVYDLYYIYIYTQYIILIYT